MNSTTTLCSDVFVRRCTKTLEARNSRTYLEEQSYDTPVWTIVHIMDYLSACRILTVLPLFLSWENLFLQVWLLLCSPLKSQCVLINLNLPENRVACEFIFVTFMMELLSEAW